MKLLLEQNHFAVYLLMQLTLLRVKIIQAVLIGYAADFIIYNKNYRYNDIATSAEDFKTVSLLALYVNELTYQLNNK